MDAPVELGERHAFNLNSNLMVSIAANTTGRIAGSDEIFEFSAIPLDGKLDPSTMFQGITINLQTDAPKGLKVPKDYYLQVSSRGLSPSDGAITLLNWFNSLNLPFNKKICPLSWDWSFISPFIRDWLGQNTFDLMFHEEVRDIRAQVLYINDRYRCYATKVQYPFPRLRSVAQKVGVSYNDGTTTRYRALTQARVYHKLLHHEIPNDFYFNRGALVDDPSENQ
jgi:hypothetical protein